MKFLVYPELSTNSKRAMRRKKTRWGRPAQYNPHGDLLQRLSQKLGMTIDQVQAQIEAERAELLKNDLT